MKKDNEKEMISITWSLKEKELISNEKEEYNEKDNRKDTIGNNSCKDNENESVPNNKQNIATLQRKPQPSKVTLLYKEGG